MTDGETCTIELTTGTRIHVAHTQDEVHRWVENNNATLLRLASAVVPGDHVVVDRGLIAAIYPDGRTPQPPPLALEIRDPHTVTRAVCEAVRRYFPR